MRAASLLRPATPLPRAEGGMCSGRCSTTTLGYLGRAQRQPRWVLAPGGGDWAVACTPFAADAVVLGGGWLGLIVGAVLVRAGC